MEKKDYSYMHELFKKFLNNACVPGGAEVLLRLLREGTCLEHVEAAIEKHLNSLGNMATGARGDTLDRIYYRLAMAQECVSEAFCPYHHYKTTNNAIRRCNG